MDFNIVITSNGPGEMSAWVHPMIQEIRVLLPQARILIALVPCPHSSGLEVQYGNRFHGATVLTPRDTLHYVLSGQLPSHVVLAKHGIILHLGGDQLFSVAFGWRSQFPVTIYTEHLAQWKSRVTRYFLRDHKLLKKHKKKIPENKLSVVGDLMTDAVQTNQTSFDVREKLNLRMDAPVVSLLPGSKPIKVLYMTAFMLRIVDELSMLMPQVQFILPQSPFTPLSQIRQAVQEEKYLKTLNGARGKIVHDRNSTSIITPQGNKVQIVPSSWHYNALQISDLSLTLPGTNTAELAALGTPMLVMLPLQRPDLIPLDGLAGQITKLPLFGTLLKRFLIKLKLAQTSFLALPNQKSGQEIVPELIGHLSSEHVALEAQTLLSDPILRRDISMNLRKTMPAHHTSTRILMELVEILKAHDPRFSHLIPYSQEPSVPEDSDSTSHGQAHPNT